MRALIQAVLKLWPLTAACASAALLAIAIGYFEHVERLAPCELCYLQRDVYWAALAIGMIGFAIAYVRAPWVRPAVDLLLGVVFLTGAAIAGYHAGVEWKWWPGPSTCTGSGTASAADLNALLAGVRVKVVRCDEAAWRMAGLSMAGWNFLVSLGLVALSLAAARKTRHADD